MIDKPIKSQKHYNVCRVAHMLRIDIDSQRFFVSDGLIVYSNLDAK